MSVLAERASGGLGFNEAAASMLRKAPLTTYRGEIGDGSFNEAAASMLRKARQRRRRKRRQRRFNEAAASMLRKAVLGEFPLSLVYQLQ